MKDRLKREFYTEICRLEKWNVRTLRTKIGGVLYERTVLSGKAERVIDAEIASLCPPRRICRADFMDRWRCSRSACPATPGRSTRR